MGNSISSPSDSENGREKGSRVLFFLHRTWTVIISERWLRTRVRRTVPSDSVSDYESQYSQYSFCSCSQCQRNNDEFSSGFSEFFDSGSSMAPNSEESSRIGQFPLIEDSINKEKQRPPIYNPEDYAISLKKWGRKNANGGMVTLYTNSSTSEIECSRSQGHSFRDYRNPMLISSGSEMTLRQFGTVTELLAKLKSDLRLAYPSFVQEFVGDHLDGVTLLLDLLRAIQLSQSNNAHQVPGSSNTTGKIPPSIQRRALLDELSCLQCLLNCCSRYSEAVRKLTASSASLFTLAICIMSNVNKSRILALQLLTKACEHSSNGHTAVSEAMSTLRLRFGEPMRFRFLIGMLTSAGGQKELLAAGMKFLNKFLDTASTPQKRLYIQAELDQAGFDIATIKKNIGNNPAAADLVFEEIDHWDKHHIDIETLSIRLDDAERDNDALRDKVLLLERRVQILQEEKGILISLEQCLKERCSELQGEVRSLKSDKSTKGALCLTKKKADALPSADDEGISSSERSPSPEHDIHPQCSQSFNLYNDKNGGAKVDNKDDEEETTIDEVIEELRNIINDAETEQYVKEERKKEQERKRIEEAQVKGKLQMRVDADDYALDNETEIIPTNIYPQPPRKARSLVHLFIPAEDYDYCNKELFFENETAYTSEEGSDSLLSASKCQLPRLEKENNHRIVLDTREKPKVQERKMRLCSRSSIKRSESFRHVEKTHFAAPVKQSSFDGSYYYNTPVMVCHQKQKVVSTTEELQAARMKSKSLDRIDDGLDSMVDIVVTDHKIEKNVQRFHTKSDSGNVSGTSLSRSISNVFLSPRKSKLSCHSDEKQKMFLPVQRDGHDVPYYFPRIQEKKTSTSSSFLIKRGHANAGLYSGQIHHTMTKHKDFISGSSRSHGKVTDLPSGLY